jgi:hypothetical protein
VFLKEHPEIRQRIETAVRAKLGLGIPVKITTGEVARAVSQTA